ncbi:MAG: TldD/PmbA family protein [Candidatus Latescibacterota bacterium]|nr:MAG: TldD/PmbA family protein [Candidatus Latescibacterota bacterium]
MRDLTDIALNLAKLKGASYADIRIVRGKQESLEVKNGSPEQIKYSESLGFGVRVIVDGAWGFASSSRLEKDEIERVTQLAVRIARASATAKIADVVLSTLEPVQASYKTPFLKDPFEVPLAQKLDLLLGAEALLRREREVKVARGSMIAWREEKTFASTEGSFIQQQILHCGAGIMATAVRDGDVQVRSYPNSFRGNFASSGYEFIESLGLAENAERVASEAVQLLGADHCPSKITTVIIDGSQLALQVHESCGHPIELDRVFGTEASYAGTSFLTTDKLGKFRYGSPIVNIVADATTEGGLGTFGFDDEGVPAQRVQIVKDGIFCGYLTSRETAARLGIRSGGAMRADGWNRIPLIRMTNVSLEPGDWKLEDMIADTDEGIYLETNKSWSIDEKRLNFQFGTEVAWEIKRGKLGRMLKNPTYTSITPRFWGSCDAIANRDYWKMWGTPNCGKGEPVQIMHTGHGASPARFRNIQVGVTK